MYAKVFTSMYDGSLCTVGPWEALVTFQQMLILADRYGVVDMTPEAISRRTTIPLEIIERGIAALEQPDSSSRDSKLEGRRIVRIADNRSWGWEIVNYAKYRQIRSAEERRDYQREWQRRHRAQTHPEQTSGIPPEQEKPARRGKRPIGDWVPSDELVAKLSTRYQKTADQMQRHYTELRDYCLRTGRKYADYDAAYRTAVRDNWGFK